MDSRFPTHYLTDKRIMRMPADAFRFFVLATAWSVSNKTDGLIERDDLYLIPFADEDAPALLVKQGLWTVTEAGWMIVDFNVTQTSAAQMEASLANRRKADADRQKKKYDRDKKKEHSQSSRENNVRIEGKAEARQGKAKASLDEGYLSEAERRTIWEATPPSSNAAVPLGKSGSCPSCGHGYPTNANLQRGEPRCRDCIDKAKAAS